MASQARIGYCIRRRDDPAPPAGLTGIDGLAVHALAVGELAVWLSAEAPGPATVERVRAHDRVVRAALRSATPLPLRYGTRFADENEALRFLRARAAELTASLDRVAGHVEMGLRLVWKEAPESDRAPDRDLPAPRSGREYLERRRDEIHAADALRRRAGAILDRLETHFPEIPAVRAPGSEPGVAGSVAHLVQVDSLDSYRSLVRSARDDLVEVDLILSGPWAPYSFA